MSLPFSYGDDLQELILSREEEGTEQEGCDVWTLP